MNEVWLVESGNRVLDLSDYVIPNTTKLGVASLGVFCRTPDPVVFGPDKLVSTNPSDFYDNPFQRNIWNYYTAPYPDRSL